MITKFFIISQKVWKKTRASKFLTFVWIFFSLFLLGKQKYLIPFQIYTALNALGDEGCKELCIKILKHNNNITSLNIESNQLKTESAKYLCEMLISNSTITKLQIGEQILFFMFPPNLTKSLFQKSQAMMSSHLMASNYFLKECKRTHLWKTWKLVYSMFFFSTFGVNLKFSLKKKQFLKILGGMI